MTIRELYEMAELGGSLDKELFIYVLQEGGRIAVGGKIDSITNDGDAIFLWSEE